MRDVAGEDHLLGGEALLVGEGLQRVEVGAPARELPHQHEAHVGRDEALPVAREADEVLGLLVRDEPADEEQVRPAVLEQPAQHRARRLAVAGEVEADGQDPGARDPERLELPPVELAVREAQVAVPGQGRELLPAHPADPGHVVVPAGEVLGRGDVVVEEHAPPAVLAKGRGEGRGQGEVEDDHVVAAPRRPLCEPAAVPLQVGVDVQRVDVRLVPPRPERVPHQTGRVPDGITPVQRRDPLIDSHGEVLSLRDPVT